MCTRASHQAGVSGRPVALLVLMLMCVAVAGDDGECGAELGGCNGTNAEGAAAQGKGTDKTAAVVPKPMANGARGFGEQFEWYSFDDGLRAAEAFAKPAVVVIHKSWCGACRNLGPVFAASEELMSLAKDFVMINVADDEEPRDAAWHPDGSYIPRIFFYDGEMGELYDDELKCSSNREDGKFKHYCSDPALIANSMREVLKMRKHHKDLEAEIARSLPGAEAEEEEEVEEEAAKSPESGKAEL